MRAPIACCLAVLSACAATQKVSPPAAVTLAADTAGSTTEGNAFIAPAGWTISVRGPATILQAPEGDSRIALVDVRAKDSDAAVAAAWAAYDPDAKWPLKLMVPAPDKDGWTDRHHYDYLLSPNLKRGVAASTQRVGEIWTVAIYDMTEATGEKRASAASLIFGRLLPKGYTRESFAGKKANKLDAAKIAALSDWVQTGMKELRLPGVAIGVVQDGKVVFAGGFGVRDLARKEPPGADTLFMIASNTKALTTLMLARLVDEKKLAWDEPVTRILPSFKLGNAETTSQMKVKHLICACTGLPRQDLEWLFEFGAMTPQGALDTLATVQPTSKFGELFQYSNLLAGAGGFVGGHVLYPQLELGEAYDRAMSELVFKPLGMKATTFDYAKAIAGDHAFPHSSDVDGKTARAAMELNYSIIPLRPAGAAWSNVTELLSYVSMELAEGKLPDGKRFISKEPLLERRVAQVPIGKDATYGMGLIVNSKYGTPVVQHGGDLIGFHSNMMWLPEVNVGAVILTNGDSGVLLRGPFQRKLLELLFDGKSEADQDLKASAKTYFDQIAADRKLLVLPADAAEAAKLSKQYKNAALGELAVSQNGAAVIFDFGEWKSEVGTTKNPDGTVSFSTIAPGASGFEFVVGSGTKRTLTIRDSQHEYIFTEQSRP